MLQELSSEISHFRSELLMSRYEKSRETGKEILGKIQILNNAGVDKKQLLLWKNFIQEELKICQVIQGLVENQQKTISRRSRSKGNTTKIDEKRQKKWGSPKTNNKNTERNKLIKSSKSNEKNIDSKSAKKKNPKKPSNQKSPNYKNLEQTSKQSLQQKSETKNIGKWGPRNKKIKSQASNTSYQPLYSSMKLESPSIISRIKNESQYENKTNLFQTWDNNEIISPIKQQQDQIQNHSKKLQPDQVQIIERELILPITMPQFFKNTQARRLVVCFYEKCANLLAKLNGELIINEVFQLDSINQYWGRSRPEEASKGYNLYMCPYTKQDSKTLSKILLAPKNILVMYAEKDRILMTQKPSLVTNSQFLLNY